MPPTVKRTLAAVLSPVAAIVLALAPATPAAAEPDEAHNQQLIQNLEAAARGYLEAQEALEHSKARQVVLRRELEKATAQLAPLRKQVGAIAAAAYTTGRLSGFAAMLGAGTSEEFFTRATMLEEITLRQDQALSRLLRLEEKARTDKEAIDAEAAIQTAQVAEMKKRMKAAEQTLIKVGGKSIHGWLDPNSPAAIPAPRNPDGSWPKENCSVKDPTKTGGCITPRLLHAYEQARANDYTRYTKCWRTQSWGEHPKGRACDFSSARATFSSSDASGDDKRYGDRLASFFIKNSRALGVLYVIWYRKIWFPGLGWRSYSGCCGASAEHTNHVHLSVY
ncbi:hypothetical protein AB0H43_14610 [Hamadaea sp. NPDC050747]|uniref:coiled-coil domain-containing protein n=1 Tax=Hamadaea sp. NPDC050747 TaxID=3155789 RepID=UPI0033F0A646